MHEIVSLPHSLQMVALYQDPKGERVFRTVESSQPTSKPTTQSNHQQMQMPVLEHPDYEPAESLRRRVRELETKLSQYQVECMHVGTVLCHCMTLVKECS